MAVKWRPIVVAGLAVAALAVLVIWLQHARLVGHWIQVHTGTVNEPGPYYGFWSGFGSDLEEFGILGAIGAGIYSLVRKFNCHEPGCWRVSMTANTPPTRSRWAQAIRRRWAGGHLAEYRKIQLLALGRTVLTVAYPNLTNAPNRRRS
jgi:hypothetical protein